jgi:catechol-2,3-dioxygenase
MTSPSSVPSLAFSHMGIYVTDLARMEDFYTRLLGFTVTDRGDLGATRIVFLSRDPREHHQIILASGRPGEVRFNPINQISFRMAEFAGLREMHRRLQREGVAELAPVSHGNALSVYFRDPEGNRLELFVDTPWYVQQPLRVPMDMTLSDAGLWAWAEAEARKQPGFQPVEAWRADVERTMSTRRGVT